MLYFSVEKVKYYLERFFRGVITVGETLCLFQNLKKLCLFK